MTNRELYTAIINGTISAEVIAKAKEELAKLDKKNSDRSAKLTPAQIENEKLYPSVLALLNSETAVLSTDVATSLGVSTSKATGLLGNLLKLGKVAKIDVKVPKKGTQKGWLLVETDEGENSPSDED